MDLTDQLRCLFSGRIVEEDGSYLVEVPKREVEVGEIEPNDIYRIGLFGAPTANETTQTDSTPARAKTQSESDHGSADRNSSEHTKRNRQRGDRRQQGPPTPPVEQGETRTVEIEDMGDQGDGLARVERGFVVIVPETKRGERVRIEISSVQENVAFGEVVERLHAHE